MPGENKTDTTHESETTTGVFDGLGAAPQASKDARAEEATDKGKETPGDTTTTPPETEPETEGKPESETPEGETPEGEPEGDKTPEGEEPSTEQPIVIRGRTFATQNDLIKTYEQSSDEGVRLHNLDLANKHLIQQLQTALVTAEDKLADLPYPELLSEEALEALSPAKQTEYLLKKGKWADTQDTCKTERENMRKNYKEYQGNISSMLDASDREMSGNTEQYPDYNTLKPQRENILKTSPFLADRPESNYIAYWVAYGIDAFGKNIASAEKTAESKVKAKATASAAAVQGKGGKPRTVTTEAAEEESDLVKAHRSHTSVL